MKKGTATNITAHNCPHDALSINRRSKGSEYFSTSNQEHQIILVQRCLGDTDADGKTMLMVSRETGIERASICRRVAELRKAGLIWSCGVRNCAISNTPAEYLTTNYRIALRYFLNLCKDLIYDLDADSVLTLHMTIKSYCVGDGNIAVLYKAKNPRLCFERWERIKQRIDKEYGKRY